MNQLIFIHCLLTYSFKKLWRLVDIDVAGFIGPNSAASRFLKKFSKYCFRDWTGAVCTFEKANSLISHAILDSSLEEYGSCCIFRP